MRQLRNIQTGEFLPNGRLVLLSTPQKVQRTSRADVRLVAFNVSVPWTRPVVCLLLSIDKPSG